MASDPDTFRVSPSLQNMPGVNAPAIESAGPGMLVRAGQGITRAAGVASELYQRELREQNATRVTEALTQLTQFQHELTYGVDGDDSGWAAQMGKNALERPDGLPLDEEVGRRFRERVESLSLGLGNDAQRKLLRERAMAMETDLRGRVQQHVAQQGIQYRQDTLTGVIESGQRLMGTATDPLDIARAADMTRQAAGQLADMRGLAGEQREQFYREMLTPGHMSAIGRLVAADEIDAAMQYFNDNREDLTREAIDRVQPMLLEQQAETFARTEADRMWSAFENNNAASSESLQMPVMGFGVNSPFGVRRGNRNHGGVDIGTPPDTPFVASVSGKAYVKNDPKGYGLYVELHGDDGHLYKYAHLNGVDIEDGARVTAGMRLGRTGGVRGAPGAGNSTGPHLHYEVRRISDNTPVDPLEHHSGAPKINPNGAPAEMRFPELIEAVWARTDISESQKRRIERNLREREALRRDAKNQERDYILSRAFAEIDSTGALSPATRAAVVAAGLGSSLTTLRNFEQATQDRRAGGTVSEADGLLAYGNARQMIAEGKITTFNDLLPLKPYMPDNYFKSLVDEVTTNPGSAQEQAYRIIKLMDDEIDGTGLFRDKDGKQTPETRNEYRRFIGAVTRQIEAERKRGPVTAEREREIVLGMVAKQVISATGEERYGYEIEIQYRNIPPKSRLRIARALQRQNLPVTQRRVVSAWLRMQGR